MTSPRSRRLALAPLAAALCACGPTALSTGDAPADGGPALVVLVVVDQLRGDLLERYDPVFTGGFRRLRDRGRRFTAASHRHATTETAVGHATLATGVHPSRHGLVGNNWSVPVDGGWASTYSVADSASPLTDGSGGVGRSPANLLRSGLADWIRAADRDARVVAISAKDRGAIPLGGRGGEEVYWISGARFVTSRFYRRDPPRWVRRFNEDVMPGLYRDSVWQSRVPPAEAWRSRPDTAGFEGDGVHTFLPHRFLDEAAGTDPADFVAWLGKTPRPDAAVGALAAAALTALGLGRRGSVDLLAVSFSAADYIGHDYGPLSREQMDNLLHLDGVLGRLMDRLDLEVGPGRWVMALTSDHGTMDAPEWRLRQGEPARRFGAADQDAVRSALRSAIPPGGGVEALDPGAAAAALERLPFVAAAYTHAELDRAPVRDSFALLYQNSRAPGRAQGLVSRYAVELRPTEGTLMAFIETGSTHGSPYWYDRWVPLSFLGPGVAPGASAEPVYTVDVAPTLAALAGIPAPGDLDGRPLLP